jgi:hypothetical protein
MPLVILAGLCCFCSQFSSKTESWQETTPLWPIGRGGVFVELGQQLSLLLELARRQREEQAVVS